MKTLVKDCYGYSVVQLKSKLQPKASMGIKEWGQLLVLNANNEVILVYDYVIEGTKPELLKVFTLETYLHQITHSKETVNRALEIIQEKIIEKEK